MTLKPVARSSPPPRIFSLSNSNAIGFVAPHISNPSIPMVTLSRDSLFFNTKSAVLTCPNGIRKHPDAKRGIAGTLAENEIPCGDFLTQSLSDVWNKDEQELEDNHVDCEHPSRKYSFLRQQCIGTCKDKKNHSSIGNEHRRHQSIVLSLYQSHSALPSRGESMFVQSARLPMKRCRAPADAI